jgi:arylsulfatase A-like enzyme
MIMKWPGHITPGKTDVPVVNLDFYPTFMGVLNSSPEDKILDGVDLAPLFEGGTLEERPLFWHFPIYLQQYNPQLDQGRDPLFRTRPGTAMRFGKWKLHEYFEDGALELYDLYEDPGETINLADILPEEAAELHQMMNGWRLKTNAPVPTERNPDMILNSREDSSAVYLVNKLHISFKAPGLQRIIFDLQGAISGY